jgi:DNA-directed RNA polymerase subunit RPC12/RpoP
MEDRTIECRDCGNEFIFTVGEQEFYQEKGFTNDPVRCKDCRQKRKNERNDFNRSREM